MAYRLAPILAVLGLLACSPSDDPDGDSEWGEDPAVGSGDELAVNLRSDPSAPPACPERKTCIEPWREFAGKVSPRRPRLVTGWVEMSLAISAEHPRPEPVPAEELQAELVMSSGFGRDGANLRTRPVDAVLRSEQRTGALLRQQLILTDEWVGAFDVVVVRPDTDGALPAVVGYPDRGETVEQFLTDRHGYALAEADHVVLVIVPRVDGGDRTEDLASRLALEAGSAVVCGRATEALVARKYLLSRVDVTRRVSLLGHGHGSAVVNLASRLEPEFTACVSDRTSSYREVSDDGFVLAEAAPVLARWALLLNDFSTSPVPTLIEPRGLPDGDAVVRFIKDGG